MLLVVIVKGESEIANPRFNLRRGREGDIVAFHGPHKALAQPVALRAADRSGQWPRADCRRKSLGLVCRVDPSHYRSAIQFHRRFERVSNVTLDRRQHPVTAHVVAVPAG